MTYETDTIADIDIAWGPSGKEVYERTYSRDLPDGTKETWRETVDRVIRGNCELVPEQHLFVGEQEQLRELLLNFKALPAGRHLWTSGASGRQFNRNCHRAGWGPLLSDHFCFVFDELMKGGGVGANYSQEYLETLPPVKGQVVPVFYIRDDHPDANEVDRVTADTVENKTSLFEMTVQDTREGWVDAIRFLIDRATTPGLHVIVFNLSNVRERGAPIRGFGGRASGPGPLADALEATSVILNSKHGSSESFGTLDAMNIDHALSTCVVAGNVRRSARMSILHWQDPAIFDFINCKADSASHWTTNISVEVDDQFFAALAVDDPHATEVFNAVTEAMLTNGEPGFYNSSLASAGEHQDVRATNPCGEMPLEEWEACNLAHVNLAGFSDPRSPEIINAFRLMARFAIRATFAEILNERQAEVEGKNRRIGIGFFGFQEWLGRLGIRYSEAPNSSEVKSFLQEFKSAVVLEADTYASQLGIPLPIKHTTIAPTGTIAKLPGVTEGIHPVYSKYYERRIRYAENDPALFALDDSIAIEDCVYSANTKVAVFATRDTILDSVPEHLIEQADEISPDSMLRVQRLVQENYANNAVSFTVNVPQSLTVGELRSALRQNLPYLKGTTIMVDASRPQSPYTRISFDEFQKAAVQQVGQSFDECSTGACPVR